MFAPSVLQGITVFPDLKDSDPAASGLFYLGHSAGRAAPADRIQTYITHESFHIYKPPFCERHRWGYETLSRINLRFFFFLCYTPLAGYWHTTEPEEVSGGAV